MSLQRKKPTPSPSRNGGEGLARDKLHGDASNDLARLTEYCKAGRRKVGF